MNKSKLKKDLEYWKIKERKSTTMEEILEAKDKIEQIKNELTGKISYDECVDITQNLDDEIYEQKGTAVAVAFYYTLRHYGYSPEEIIEIHDQYKMYPEEVLKKIPKKQRKKYPNKSYFYNLKKIPPLKYKRVLRKIGVDVEHDPYWHDLEKYC